MEYFTVSRLSPNIERVNGGFLLCRDVAITRAADRNAPLVYLPHEVPEVRPGSDGRVRVIRDEADILNKDFLRSLEGMPVTLGHPPGFINPRNWKSYSTGETLNARPGEGKNKGKPVADILIKDQDAIDFVEKAKAAGQLPDVSLGYEAGFEDLGGGYGRQMGFVANHTAIVKKGRAGRDCAIHDQDPNAPRRVYDEASVDEEDSMSQATDKPSLAARIVARLTGKTLTTDAVAEAVEAESKATEVTDAADDPTKQPPGNDGQQQQQPPAGGAQQPAQGGEQTPKWAADILAAQVKIIEILQGQNGQQATQTPPVQDAAAEVDDETKARAEILAPGIALTADVKTKALAKFADSDDGKTMLKAFLGGKALDAVPEETIDVVFAACASHVAEKNRRALADASVRTQRTTSSTPDSAEEAVAKMRAHREKERAAA